MYLTILLSLGLFLTAEGRKSGKRNKDDSGGDENDGDREQRPDNRYPLSQGLVSCAKKFCDSK